jgi:predicted nucleotidyltransferase
MQITDEAISGLRLIQQICAKENRRFILVGATVPQILIDLAEGREKGSRQTRDLDAVVEVDSWPDYNGLKNQLLESGFRPGEQPHELRFGRDARFDLLPFGPKIVLDDRITWPETDHAMSALGFEEAFQSATRQELRPGLSVPVVSIAALTILKISAYLDRPEDRARDMVDLVYCFSEYERFGDARFELAETEVDGQPLYFEEAGAFLVGAEVARLAGPKAQARVQAFFRQLKDEFARPISQILGQERRMEDEPLREELFRLLGAFRAGFEQNR